MTTINNPRAIITPEVAAAAYEYANQDGRTKQAEEYALATASYAHQADQEIIEHKQQGTPAKGVIAETMAHAFIVAIASTHWDYLTCPGGAPKAPAE